MLLCGICDLYVPLCFISDVQVLEVFLWVSMDGLRFFIVIGDVGLNWLLISDVRGELVVNDCHWVVMWVCICSIDCSYSG